MTPSSVPGKVSGCPSPPLLGAIVVTYCFACSVVDASKACAWKLRKTSTFTAPIRSMPTIAPAVSLARFKTAADSASDMSGTSFGGRRRHGQAPLFAQFKTPMGTGKYHRHEQQRGNRCKYQAADHGAAQGCILLGPFAQAQRHGDHADLSL